MLQRSSIDAIRTTSDYLPVILTDAQQARLFRLRTARAEYGQAVSDSLDAVRRYSELSLSGSEKEELVRQLMEREQAAFLKYKQAAEATD